MDVAFKGRIVWREEVFIYLFECSCLCVCVQGVSPSFFRFSAPPSVNELYVDDPDKDSGGKIEVSLNISLPNLHCDCEYISYIHI